MYTILSLSLPFVVLAQDQFSEDEYKTRSQKDLEERCLPFSNDTLYWETEGYVDIPQDNDVIQAMKKKSSLKFYGGLTQHDFFEGDGGLIGTNMILSDDGLKCSKKPNTTRLLVIQPCPL